MKARITRFVPRGKAAIIVGIVVLIVLVSSGVFYFKYFNYVHAQSLLNAGPRDPYASFGTMIMNDPLSDNSLGYFWAEGEGSDGGSCEFTGDGYELVTTSQEPYHLCTSNSNASDFAYQVQVTILQGNSAGIVFRADNGDCYYFQIGIAQTYELDAIQSGRQNILTSSTLPNGNANVAIHGQGQSNTLAVVANGSAIDLYVNGQKIDSVTGGTFSQGYVGVAATTSVVAVFSNAQVWTA